LGKTVLADRKLTFTGARGRFYSWSHSGNLTAVRLIFLERQFWFVSTSDGCEHFCELSITEQ
jgi:hypothetical protein